MNNELVQQVCYFYDNYDKLSTVLYSIEFNEEEWKNKKWDNNSLTLYLNMNTQLNDSMLKLIGSMSRERKPSFIMYIFLCFFFFYFFID